jgi:hypothetical protein
MSDFTWSSEAVDILRELWGRKSASTIGALIGTTKNSVIGKADRLGLPQVQTGRYTTERCPVCGHRVHA